MALPWSPALLTAVLYALFLVLRLCQPGMDLSRFVTAGDRFSNPAEVPESLSVLRNQDGYDGQFYYRLALDPFTAERREFGIELDNPMYRHQRILYPVLVWALSRGDPQAALRWMVGVNFAALCLLGWIGGLLARSAGASALSGLVFAFYPGFLLTLSRNLVEIVAACVLFAALLLLRQRRHVGAMVLLALAALAKETTLLVSVALLLLWLVGVAGGRGTEARDRPGSVPPYVGLVPILTYASWQCLLAVNWEHSVSAVLAGRHHGSFNLGPPFQGLGEFLLASFAPPLSFRRLIEVFFMLAFTVAVFGHLRRSGAAAHEKLSWALYVGLACLLTHAVWVEDWAFLRALSEFYGLGALVLLQAGPWPARLALAGAGALWGVLCLLLLTGRL
jgi:hypothetical protein